MDWEGILNLLAKLYREAVVLSTALQEARQIISQKDQIIAQKDNEVAALKEQLHQDKS